MGLFRKSKKEVETETGRVFDFNKESLHKQILKAFQRLYDHRTDHASEIFAEYLQLRLNSEVILLAEGKKVSHEDTIYRRGRIDALRSVLHDREKYIADRKNAKDTKETGQKTEHEAKRRYFRSPATSAGLSI